MKFWRRRSRTPKPEVVVASDGGPVFLGNQTAGGDQHFNIGKLMPNA